MPSTVLARSVQSDEEPWSGRLPAAAENQWPEDEWKWDSDWQEYHEQGDTDDEEASRPAKRQRR